MEQTRRKAFGLAAVWRPEEGIALIRGLLDEHPSHPLLLLDLAELMLAMPDVPRALELIHQAGKPADARLLPKISALLARAGEPDRAVRCLLDAAGSSPMIRLECAILLERLNRTEEAGDLLEPLFAGGSPHPDAFWLAARLSRRAGDPAGAVDVLRSMRERVTAVKFPASAGYELALALDDLGDHSAAFGELMETKRRVASGMSIAERAAWDGRLAAERDQREALGSCEDFLGRWQRVATDPELPPVVVLTGHPRSGTTLIERRLARMGGYAGASEEQFLRMSIERATAGIARAEEESPLVVMDRLGPEVRSRALGLYRAFLGDRLSAGVKALVDKEPSYLDYLPVLARFLPSMKVIVCQRDPRDVLLSSLFVPLPVNNVSTWAWLEPGRAAKRLQQVNEGWRKLRSILPGGWMEVSYESFVVDETNQLAAIARFAGLDQGREGSPSGTRISSPSYPAADARTHTGSVGRWKNYSHLLGAAFDALS